MYSNQRQVAFALLNHESTKKAFPGLRAPLKPGSFPWGQDPMVTGLTSDWAIVTWVSLILPFMEQNTAWAQMNSGNVDPALYDLVLPVMQCRSSGIATGENRINYVVNAGPNNTYFSDGGIREYGRPERQQRDAKMYTIFFDVFAGVGQWSDSPDTWVFADTKVSLDNIAVMDGTSMTILLSENLDAGYWIWYLVGGSPNVPVAGNLYLWSTNWTYEGYYPSRQDPHVVEHSVGFCFPNVLSSITDGEIPTYEPVRKMQKISLIRHAENQSS